MGSGEDREREFREWFYTRGGAAIRIPASGARTNHPLPDVFGAVDGQRFGCELKYTTRDRVRFKKTELVELLRFCEPWDAKACLVGRFSRDVTWYVLQFEDWREFDELTDQKSFSMSRDDAAAGDYATFEEVVADVRSNTDSDTKMNNILTTNYTSRTVPLRGD